MLLKRLADARSRFEKAAYDFNLCGTEETAREFDEAKREFNEARLEVERWYIPL